METNNKELELKFEEGLLKDGDYIQYNPQKTKNGSITSTSLRIMLGDLNNGKNIDKLIDRFEIICDSPKDKQEKLDMLKEMLIEKIEIIENIDKKNIEKSKTDINSLDITDGDKKLIYNQLENQIKSFYRESVADVCKTDEAKEAYYENLIETAIQNLSEYLKNPYGNPKLFLLAGTDEEKQKFIDSRIENKIQKLNETENFNYESYLFEIYTEYKNIHQTSRKI